MQNSTHKFFWLIVATSAFSSICTPAYAYLDAGTGSIFLQGLFAGVAGVLAVIKIYWGRFKDKFLKIKNYFFKRSKIEKNNFPENKQ
jgi:hypothetical protein